MVSEDADPDIPHAKQILGKDLVVWKDKKLGKWVAFEDRCPHRLAQLSEGRIDKNTGALQCNYHGWTFSGAGQCQSIPQVSGSENSAQLISSPRACATVYPTVEREGLIWVWGESGPNSHFEATAATWKGLGQNIDKQGKKTFQGDHGWYYREIPSGYIANKENSFNDPSHDSILHHKASPAIDRSRAPSFPESTLSEITIDGFTTTHSIKSKVANRSFQFQDKVVPPTGNVRMSPAFEGVAYTTPAAHGKIYSFITFLNGNDKSRGFSPLSIIFAIRWIAHLMTNDYTDADNVIQYGADRNRALDKGKQVYLPSVADRGVSALWTWLEKHAGGGPPVSTLTKPIDPNHPVPRRVLLDRYHQHTVHCKSCSRAMKGFEVARGLFGLVALGLFVASVSSLTVAIGSLGLKAAVTSGGPLVLAALSLTSALIASFCSSMVAKFIFVDYDKNHISKK